MSNSRRDFIKKTSLFMGGMTVMPTFPASIERALLIEAAKGSTFLDAEHIVFLMQENRSFDHCLGTLKGVRGFNDPRAMQQPNGMPVWFQTNEDQKTYGPYHLDIENTKATWLGSLPHSWSNMTAARNNGTMDNWLIAKKPGDRDLAHLPLTMGYFTRNDIPFYYALADAFTVCDQHFCSSLTGTSANRSYFWSGAIRENPRDPESVAHVDNSQINYQDVNWTTYPERLEKANVSWRVYQNELSLPVGFEGEESDWLANFTDNNLEFYKNYNVRYHKAHIDYLNNEVARMQSELENTSLDAEARDKLERRHKRLSLQAGDYTHKGFEKLSDFEKAIHQKAFTTNINDPDYHTLEEVDYVDNGVTKKMQVPKGDILHQFRQDVQADALPTVSWLVAPCNFSDHPDAPWYGAWYVSEVLDILTKDPEIWKKTIFVLTYDENDGYFDHVAPFVPPLSTDASMGKVPAGMDTQDEWVTNAQENKRNGHTKSKIASPIGLGFRVPLVIASPWTKGGWVNSEVCDLTSSLQFLEYFIEKKTGKKVVEENISEWRRSTCGNLTSVFQSANDLQKVDLDFIDRNEYVSRILNARSKRLPSNVSAYTAGEVLGQKVWQDLPNFPKQEAGIKKACALPYTCNTNIRLDAKTKQLQLVFDVDANKLKNKDYTAPFQVHAMNEFEGAKGRNWNFAVADQEDMIYQWDGTKFESEVYKLKVHGPNGFYRSFEGKASKALLNVEVVLKPNYRVVIELANISSENLVCTIVDENYSKQTQQVVVKARRKAKVELDYANFKGWYDFVVSCESDDTFNYQYAGRIEAGQISITDPYMASFSN